MYASGELVVTPAARELGIDIVMRPPVPVYAKPLLELVNQITIGWLPSGVRRQYGFRWDPVRAVALRGGAEYVKRLALPVADRAGFELRPRGQSRSRRETPLQRSSPQAPAHPA
jgi:uncharacterized protein (DUF2236 family)